jgi:hypothetical protein
LGRIEYLDGTGVKQVAQALRPGTTMVVTDFAASDESRTQPDFTVIAVDRATQESVSKTDRFPALSGVANECARR